MKRRAFIAGLTGTAALPIAARAQAPAKVARIGWVTPQQASSLTAYADALRAGLAELGYVEGRNLAIVFRFGDDDVGRVPELVTELARVPVDLIVASGPAAIMIGKLDLKIPMPVVYVMSADPVSAGLADSLAKPRGNMTGLTFMAAELNAKRLELLREIDPRLRRVALIANPEHAGEHLERTVCENAGSRLGLAIDYFPTRTYDELTAAFKKMSENPPQGINLFSDLFAIQNRKRIMDFAMSQRAPVIAGWALFAESGAICTYGPYLAESYRRLASYIDRILKGAKPADLPIEQPTKFQLVVNMRTATALGLTIPPTVMTRADEVIE